MLNPNPWQRRVWKQDHIKVVPDKDRIMKWNIVPGDFVRQIPDRFNQNDNPERYEVLSVDKWQNKVYLKGTRYKTEAKAKWVPYSKLQLWIGNLSLHEDGETTSVYATRIGSTNLKYNYRKKRFEWVRYAEATSPPMPFAEKRRIPWPKEKQPPYRAKQNKYYDTEADNALDKTWLPFVPQGKVSTFNEESYIGDLFTNKDLPSQWQASIPMEHIIASELTNPHSRARRQERWQERLAMLERSKQEYVKLELADLKGRRRQDAKADGVFRWKIAVRKYKARRNWQRWVRRGAKAKMEMRIKRRHRRSARKLRRLRMMKLKDAKNQVIPS